MELKLKLGSKVYQVLKSKLKFPFILFYLGKIGMELKVKWKLIVSFNFKLPKTKTKTRFEFQN
jgi:hypothetical protein